MRTMGRLILALVLFDLYRAQQTADTSANSKTRQVLSYIAGVPRQGKVLSGQFAGFSPDTFSTAAIDDIQQQIGVRPAILSCDWACGWNTLATPQNLINFSCNAALKAHWSQGGLVTVSMHLPNPVSTNGGGYKDRMNLDFADLARPQTQTGQRWRLFLDRMGQGLGDLQQAGVTVLFRPFHEMNGDWFYWGNQDSQTFKSVWIDMFNYLTTTKNLHNLLWVYSPDQSRGSRLVYYPGAAYVDVVALDAYTDDPNMMNGYDEMLSLNKTLALSEIGPSTTNGQFEYTRWLTAIETTFPKVAYFLAWNDGWAPLANKYPCAFYHHHRVINRDATSLNNSLTIVPTTTISASSSTRAATASPASLVVYNFSNGISQWQGSNIQAGPWQSNEFTVLLTDSVKADVQLSAGAKYALFTNQQSTFVFGNYRRLVGRARVASWGFSSGASMAGKLYIKTGSSWTWYDSGSVQLNSSTATSITLNLNAIPASALADIREVGIEYTSSANGGQSAVYLAYVTAEN